jgi:CHAD domain-containing protein
MPFDIERIHKSANRVVKFLRKNSRRPRSNAVHDLRTSINTLETTFITVGLSSKRTVKRFLRDLRKLRERAGKVRNMDVLIDKVLTLKQDGEQDCLIRLLGHLAAEWNIRVKKLHRLIEAVGPKLRRDLKRNSKRVEELLQEAETDPGDSVAIPMTIAKAMMLSSELKAPSRLTKKNLHGYRVKVKELRNVFYMSDHFGSPELLEKLREVKDAIGDWHDWGELAEIAAHVLDDHGASCKLLKQIKKSSESKYDHALVLTGRWRSQYLKGGPTRRKELLSLGALSRS